MPLRQGMLLQPSFAAPPVHAAPSGACWSLLGMLLPTGLAAPLQEGLQLRLSASKHVAPAYHHFNFKKILTITTTAFKKGDGLRGFNFVTK